MTTADTQGYTLRAASRFSCTTTHARARAVASPAKNLIRWLSSAATRTQSLGFLASIRSIQIGSAFGEQVTPAATCWSSAGSDRRVRCVVSQAMTISESRNLVRRYDPSAANLVRQHWALDRLSRLRSEAIGMMPSSPPSEQQAAEAFYGSAPSEVLRPRHEVTVRSHEWYYNYEPAATIERVSPTPLLIIVCLDDTRTPAEDAIEAYQRAREPKRLLLLPGNHYDIYGRHLAAASAASRDWFRKHLMGSGS